MQTRLIEAGQGTDGKGPNWGKFCVMWFDSEWEHQSEVDPGRALLPACGWPPGFLWVADLQTAEAVYVRPGGSASYDLDKHRVWVCPMFGPFLAWLYRFLEEHDVKELPPYVALPDAVFAFHGYRRPGLCPVCDEPGPGGICSAACMRINRYAEIGAGNPDPMS